MPSDDKALQIVPNDSLSPSSNQAGLEVLQQQFRAFGAMPKDEFANLIEAMGAESAAIFLDSVQPLGPLIGAAIEATRIYSVVNAVIVYCNMPEVIGHLSEFQDAISAASERLINANNVLEKKMPGAHAIDSQAVEDMKREYQDAIASVIAQKAKFSDLRRIAKRHAKLHEFTPRISVPGRRKGIEPLTRHLGRILREVRDENIFETLDRLPDLAISKMRLIRKRSKEEDAVLARLQAIAEMPTAARSKEVSQLINRSAADL